MGTDLCKKKDTIFVRMSCHDPSPLFYFCFYSSFFSLSSLHFISSTALIFRDNLTDLIFLFNLLNRSALANITYARLIKTANGACAAYRSHNKCGEKKIKLSNPENN